MMQLLSKISRLERQIQKAPANYESVVKKWVQSEMAYDVLTDEQNQYMIVIGGSTFELLMNP